MRWWQWRKWLCLRHGHEWMRVSCDEYSGIFPMEREECVRCGARQQWTEKRRWPR